MKRLLLLALALLLLTAGIVAYFSLYGHQLLKDQIVRQLEQIGATEIQIEKLLLNPKEPSIQGISFSLYDAHLSAESLSLHWKDLSFRKFFGAIRKSFNDPQQLPVQALSFTAFEIATQYGSATLSGELSRENSQDDTIALVTSISSPYTSTIFHATGSQNLKTHHGELSIIGTQVELSKLILPPTIELPPDLSFTGGHITPSAKFSWSDSAPLDQKYWITFQKANGTYQKISFAGGYGTVVLEAKNNGIILPPFQILVQKISSGIEATDINSILSGVIQDKTHYRFLIGGTNFKAFGTTVRASRFLLSSQTTSYTTSISAKNLSIQDMLLLYPKSPVQGTGALDISLPLHISQKGASITNGQIHSRPPGGMLAYQGDIPINASPQYAFALRALRNYHYTKLNADVTLVEDGNILIQLALSGKSPEVNKTRPINVNIGIRENLYKLLESIQAVRQYGSKTVRELTK